jgi:hypothetical protein
MNELVREGLITIWRDNKDLDVINPPKNFSKIGTNFRLETVVTESLFRSLYLESFETSEPYKVIDRIKISFTRDIILPDWISILVQVEIGFYCYFGNINFTSTEQFSSNSEEFTFENTFDNGWLKIHTRVLIDDINVIVEPYRAELFINEVNYHLTKNDFNTSFNIIIVKVNY